MTLDHPRVRALRTCPVCDASKSQAALVCWPCYHRHNMRNGNLTIERIIDNTEARLAHYANDHHICQISTRDL